MHLWNIKSQLQEKFEIQTVRYKVANVKDKVAITRTKVKQTED